MNMFPLVRWDRCKTVTEQIICCYFQCVCNLNHQFQTWITPSVFNVTEVSEIYSLNISVVAPFRLYGGNHSTWELASKRGIPPPVPPGGGAFWKVDGSPAWAFWRAVLRLSRLVYSMSHPVFLKSCLVFSLCPDLSIWNPVLFESSSDLSNICLWQTNWLRNQPISRDSANKRENKRENKRISKRENKREKKCYFPTNAKTNAKTNVVANARSIDFWGKE